MNVTVSGRHMEMTDAIRDHVTASLEKIREHFDRVIDVDVVLSVQKHLHKAEFNLHANGLRIHAKESSDDMYVSIDSAINKLDRQVNRHKDRIQRHQPRTSRETREYQHHIIELAAQAEAEDPNGKSSKHKIVHREKVPLQSMSVEEATLQLDLVEDTFILFANADTGQVNVAYARGDGTYGIIEAEV